MIEYDLDVQTPDGLLHILLNSSDNEVRSTVRNAAVKDGKIYVIVDRPKVPYSVQGRNSCSTLRSTSTLSSELCCME